jgi:hypothetical protein
LAVLIALGLRDNKLASETTGIISSKAKRKRPEAAEAVRILRDITAIRPEDWDKAVDQLPLPEAKGAS